MTHNIAHNLDRYMIDLRHIVSKGKKRIGLLIGAGGPVAIKVSDNSSESASLRPLIPTIAQLTDEVISRLNKQDCEVIGTLFKIIHPNRLLKMS